MLLLLVTLKTSNPLNVLGFHHGGSPHYYIQWCKKNINFSVTECERHVVIGCTRQVKVVSMNNYLLLNQKLPHVQVVLLMYNCLCKVQNHCKQMAGCTLSNIVTWIKNLFLVVESFTSLVFWAKIFIIGSDDVAEMLNQN